MKRCIILGNGRSPSKSVVSYLIKSGYETLICADGGANSAKALSLTPDYIIGDLDSVFTETLEYFSSTTQIKSIKRQNDTDIEKCIKTAVTKKYDDIILTGVTGNRLDHTFCNLGIIIKFFSVASLKIIAEKSLLVPYTGKVKIKTTPGETISLYGFNEKTKITSEGLYYPLKNISLPFGKKESTSNVALSDSVKLHIRGGLIFVIRDFNLIKKNDLFKYI